MRAYHCLSVLFIIIHVVNGFVRTLSRPHFSRRSLDCNTAESAPDEEVDLAATNPPPNSVELTPYNEEIRAVLGRTPDKLAQNMYAIGAVQGSNVFKLVRELEDLSEAVEKTVAEMAIVAQKLKDEREATRQAKLKKSISTNGDGTSTRETPSMPTSDNL